MGDKLRGGERATSPSGSTRGLERREGQGREGEQQLIARKKKKEEKQEKGEEEAKKRKEEKSGRENKCAKDTSGVVQWDGIGPRSRKQAHPPEEDKGPFKEEQRSNRQLFDVGVIRIRERDGAEHAVREVENTENSRDGSWAVDLRRATCYEGACNDVSGKSLGSRQRVSPAAGRSVCPSTLCAQDLGTNGTRASHSCGHMRLPPASSAGGGNRHCYSEGEGVRAHDVRSELDDISEVGNNTGARARGGYKSGTSSGTERISAGCADKDSRKSMGKRKREVQRKRWRQRQRQGKIQVEGKWPRRRKEKWEIDEEYSPSPERKGEETHSLRGKEKVEEAVVSCGIEHNKESENKRLTISGVGGDNRLLENSFHPLGVGAATPTPIKAGDFVSPFSKDYSGMGREVTKKGVCDVPRVFGVEHVLGWVEGQLDVFSKSLCKVMPKGKVFPLPTSSCVLSRVFPLEPEAVILSLRGLIVSLNSLNGEGLENDLEPKAFQRKVLENLKESVKRVCQWGETCEHFSWEEFWKIKGIDYRGEEVQTAQKISWQSVQPALPPEVGGVALQDVVELGSKHYVLAFDQYLLDVQDQVYVKPPRVMVDEGDWDYLCENLLRAGVFARVHEEDIYRVNNMPLLNGLFGVSKQEYTADGVEIMRIIMNLTPVNAICRALDSDIATLPTWATMSPLQLEIDEDLVISSEDVRCFFYIFRIPPSWYPFMAFNRPLPQRLCEGKAGRWYPCSAVLPMGFKNSVSLAQHVHRVLARGALKRANLGLELEARKDRSFTSGNPIFRIYLDNFDELRRVSKATAEVIQGEVSPLVSGLREEYLLKKVPRHPKKSVASQRVGEVQGAIIDGKAGLIYPKPCKVLKYAFLAMLLVKAGSCTQKQIQVVSGGLVYLAMFRRPLLGALDHIWKFIMSFENLPPVIRLALPPEVKEELVRFVGLIPLACMSLRGEISAQVTASDASTSGGGVTVSKGLTPAGCVAAQCTIRGDVPEPLDITQVLTIGLFDGIGGLRAAVDLLGWNVVGHISVECATEASRVVESRFPNTEFVSDVRLVTPELVKAWSLKFSQVGVIVLGAGPPCQGVSGLNASKKGALKDSRSSLFQYVGPVREMLKEAFPWAQIRSLMESVASMGPNDQNVMSAHFGCEPVYLNSSDVSPAHRPRLYWIDWELIDSRDVAKSILDSGRIKISLTATWHSGDYIKPGWTRVSEEALATFTTARPSSKPPYKPAGFHSCTAEELDRWERDSFRYPPYQYAQKFCLVNKKGDLRLACSEEREVIMGYPRNYTYQCVPKSQQGTQWHEDLRCSLVGNSWNITTVAWLLGQLGQVLGLNQPLQPQEIVDRATPGKATDFQTFLLRPAMKACRKPDIAANEKLLVSKLLKQISLKGDDLLLSAHTEDTIRYHRLRASLPSRLWQWRTVAGWKWTGLAEHINVLELRAALTALRWRIEKNERLNSKFVHMVDSLVVLHSLSRGRSSSKKLKRTLLRANALILATHTQVVWAYVHTKENPADAPSRRGRKRKWVNA